MAKLLEAMDAACRVTHGASIHSLYVMVPRDMPPRLRSCEAFPPDKGSGDRFVRDDRDMLAVIPLTEAMQWTGHQADAVQLVADAALSEIRLS